MRDYILLKQAERYLQKMQTNDQVRIFNALDGLISDASSLDIKSLKRIVQFISVALILAGVYSVGWLTRGRANQIPQRSPNPVVNSQ